MKKGNIMMDCGSMMGKTGYSMMFLAWISYILVAILLILGIIALWKYINKK